MTRPGLLARLAGNPFIGWPLIALAVLIVCGWFTNNIAWWWGVLAVLCTVRTFSAMSALRRYNAWLADWEAMGRQDEAPTATSEKRRSKWALLIPVLLVALLCLGSVPLVQASPPLFNIIRLTWIVLALYGGFRLLRRFMRGTAGKLPKKNVTSANELQEEPIQLAISGTKDSPTRADAERHLPEYCLPLLARK